MRAHYPTLEKHGAQNIAAYKNQGKQYELSDHWKSIITLFFKKITGWHKKQKKRLTEIQVLTKDSCPAISDMGDSVDVIWDNQ